MGLDSLIPSRVPRLGPGDLAALQPKRIEQVSELPLSDGGIVLEIPLEATAKGLVLWMARRTGGGRKKQFELEPVGALVWRMCDGKNSCEAIVKALCREYKMSRAEANAALAAFLQTLFERRLIALKQKGKR